MGVTIKKQGAAVYNRNSLLAFYKGRFVSRRNAICLVADGAPSCDEPLVAAPVVGVVHPAAVVFFHVEAVDRAVRRAAYHAGAYHAAQVFGLDYDDGGCYIFFSNHCVLLL